MINKTQILGIVFSIFTLTVHGQVEKNKEISFSFGPALTKINNKNISEDKFKVVDDKIGYNFEFSFNKYAKRVGFGMGLGYSSYNQDVYQKGLFESFSQKDKDGNIYDLWINSDVTYKNRLSYIDVPLTLHLILGNSNKFYGFVDVGIINQFLLRGDQTMKGSVENMGKYETTNPYFSLVSQNNSYYDYKVQLYDVKKNDIYKKYNLSGHFALGLAASMNDNLFLKIQPFANIGFSDVTAKNLEGVDYEDVFGKQKAYEKTKIVSFGLSVGFVYDLAGTQVK